MADLHGIAQAYYNAVHAAGQLSIDGEPEAQLTTPIANLFSAVSEFAGIGSLILVRETRLESTRPDFSVLLSKGSRRRQIGFIELKSPTTTLQPEKWVGRNAEQWKRMSLEAEVLLLSNGRAAALFQDGNRVTPDVSLPYTSPNEWNSGSLVDLLTLFSQAKPTPVTSVRDLSRRLAVRTAGLRDRIIWLLQQDGDAGDAAKSAFESWKKHVHPQSNHRDFADGVSQVISYGMVLAALSTKDADSNADGYLTVAEARTAIRATSPVMAAAFAPLVDKPVLFAAVEAELTALEGLVSAINVDRVNRSADRRGEPWLYFFEDFLAVYDPEERKQAGVYYTPIAIVKAMVRIVDHLLVDSFEMPLGFASKDVVTLDPAAGTGTFPLAVIDRASERLRAERGPAGSAHAASSLAHNLYAFELLPGPYAVGQLRITQRLHELNSTSALNAHVVLTDTLESPLDPQASLPLFGDAEVLAEEQARAKRIKLEQKVTVVIGNPPYRRVEKNLKGRGSGGWVVEGEVPGRIGKKKMLSLFDDVLDVAKKETIFSHHASLYNLYVYFWRWAIWKAFEAHGEGPGVVAFITASSWLTGPGFVGLRKLVREVCDDAWIIDLGGDNHGANPEENVFAIETPVAVVVLARKGSKNQGEPAKVHYRRVSGTRDQKLKSMQDIADSDLPLRGEWRRASDDWLGALVPSSGSSEWAAMPSLSSLMPWQQPGCKFGRTWPIAPSAELLRERWRRFVGSDHSDRAGLFSTAKTGRNISTKVPGFVPLSGLSSDSSHEDIVRYGFRSFDRQWAFKDPRLAALERPALWRSVSQAQVFFAAPMTAEPGRGPLISVSADVPDLHYFNGRGGKDILPLFRDAACKDPNVNKGFLKLMGQHLGGVVPLPEDLAAYIYALLSSESYQVRFSADLADKRGPRVPVTTDPLLWREAVELGRELIWLHTWCQRFQDPTKGRGTRVPKVEGLEWKSPVTRLPKSLSEIRHEVSSNKLFIGDGIISNVRAEVWNYSISGMQVIPKWLGYRTAKGAGKSASSKNKLDQVRPVSWHDDWNDELLDLLRMISRTVDLQSTQALLLDRVCEGVLVSASDVPKPTKVAQSMPG